jgi:hypothetical protein
MFDRIAYLTSINYHTEANIAGCEILKEFDADLSPLIKKLKRILQEQERLGYLPQQLGEQRYKIYKGMLAAAKNVMTPGIYEEFYKSF